MSLGYQVSPTVSRAAPSATSGHSWVSRHPGTSEGGTGQACLGPPDGICTCFKKIQKNG